jgi:2-(1,2-epoxy-1,2-dihydrophenyl)acetyl-CoA isomerase
MSENDDIWIERDGSGIVTVTLNRPKTKNSVPRSSWIRLKELFEDIAAHTEDRAVIVTGSGGNFCSGAELGAAPANEGPRRNMEIVNAALFAIRDLPKPTVAAISGVAVGAGFNLALACDLAIADESARFSQIFAKRGLSVDFGGTWLLTHMVGLHRAKELAFFGDILSAADVHEMGLLNRVVPDGEAPTVARAWAERLTRLAPVALSQTKELLNLASSSDFAGSVLREASAQGLNLSTSDTREAISAFLEKREPVFQGR